MTYGEAGTSRSAVGSGLIYHGIPKVSHIVLHWTLLVFPFASLLLLFFCLFSPTLFAAWLYIRKHMQVYDNLLLICRS